MLLFSEMVWVIIYIISIINGSLNDDINLYSMSFFLLAFAGLEFSIGLLLVTFFKNMKSDYFFEKTFKKNDQIFNKNTYYNFLYKNL